MDTATTIEGVRDTALVQAVLNSLYEVQIYIYYSSIIMKQGGGGVVWYKSWYGTSHGMVPYHTIPYHTIGSTILYCILVF